MEMISESGSQFVKVFWSVGTVTLSFLLYHFITSSSAYENYFLKKFGKKIGKVRKIVFQRLLGVLFFGILSLIVVILVFNDPLYNYGLHSKNIIESLIWIVCLSPFIIIMNLANSKKKDNLSMYPQIRKKKWTRSLVILSALSWITYLMAYEFMFRGFLLFSCLSAMDVVAAVVINVSIYALVHVPKGIKEAIGAIPLGIILCILTIKTGNIWIALVVHIVMALSNEWFSLRAHPKMKIVKNK